MKTNGTTTGIGTGDLHCSLLKTGRLRRGQTVLIRTSLDPTPNFGMGPTHMMRPRDTTQKRPTADYSGPSHPKRTRIGQGDKVGTYSVSAIVAFTLASYPGPFEKNLVSTVCACV